MVKSEANSDMRDDFSVSGLSYNDGNVIETAEKSTAPDLPDVIEYYLSLATSIRELSSPIQVDPGIGLSDSRPARSSDMRDYSSAAGLNYNGQCYRNRSENHRS